MCRPFMHRKFKWTLKVSIYLFCDFIKSVGETRSIIFTIEKYSCMNIIFIFG